MTVCIRLLDVEPTKRPASLREAVVDLRAGVVNGRAVTVELSKFRKVSGAPFAYWMSDEMFKAFDALEPFERVARDAVNGTGTLDDFRFVRLWCEGPSSSWRPFAKGGETKSFFADIPTMIRWDKDGHELKAHVVEVYGGGSWSRSVRNVEYYGIPGMTWPLRASRYAPSALPAGCVFSVRSYAAFPSLADLPAAIAVCSSSVFDSLYKTLLGRFNHPEFICGSLLKVPYPPVPRKDSERLAASFRKCWSLRKALDSRVEQSSMFLMPALVSTVGQTLFERVASYRGLESRLASELQAEVAAIDGLCESLYGFAAPSPVLDEASEAVDSESVGDLEDQDDSDEGLRHELHSWLVGCALGRFDWRFATGERPPPPEPDPFDPLPDRCPGMWPEGEPREVEPPTILVDEPHHKRDLVAHVLAVAEKVKVETPANLRAWLAKEFFALHIKMYSKSRRKAPIYWQLATPSASYSVWLYIHAFTKDTMFHVEELVNDKVLLEERKANEFRNDAGESPGAAARKAIAAQDAFLEELRGMAEEVRRVKPLWKPDLDDGVIINFAPLWRLVPQHKAWQKELRETWAALVAGEYDWSHLAMHLWPERVVPKCATDRSFAIAHGLEDVFWLEDENGKWKPRATPTRPVAELVAERTSAAVTAARDSLINAPTPGGGGGASKRRRAAPKARRPRR